MGPCLWGTEYVHAAYQPNLPLESLQWGRAFGARNTPRLGAQYRIVSVASMGPCLWGTEYQRSGAYRVDRTVLQWGRAFGARNTSWAIFTPALSITASMGPCLWGTEYDLTPEYARVNKWLQWGRAFGARNTRPACARRTGAIRGFNGAVPLGHGIRVLSFGLLECNYRFNGAVPLGHGIPPR